MLKFISNLFNNDKKYPNNFPIDLVEIIISYLNYNDNKQVISCVCNQKYCNKNLGFFYENVVCINYSVGNYKILPSVVKPLYEYFNYNKEYIDSIRSTILSNVKNNNFIEYEYHVFSNGRYSVIAIGE